MEIFLKQGAAAQITFPLLAAGSATRKSGATLAAGDFKICRHTGGEWDVSIPTTATPTEIGTTGLYELPLMAAELAVDDQKYPITIACHDVAGAQWDDQAIIIRLFDTDINDVQTLGAGSINWEVIVNDGTSPLDGVDVWVTTDLPGSDVVAHGSTDALGKVTFMLDAGNYFAFKQLAGYSFTNPEAFTVAVP
jgi:hypothetical protein